MEGRLKVSKFICLPVLLFYLRLLWKVWLRFRREQFLLLFHLSEPGSQPLLPPFSATSWCSCSLSLLSDDTLNTNFRTSTTFYYVVAQCLKFSLPAVVSSVFAAQMMMLMKILSLCPPMSPRRINIFDRDIFFIFYLSGLAFTHVNLKNSRKRNRNTAHSFSCTI